jgi:hypothetical protein
MLPYNGSKYTAWYTTSIALPLSGLIPKLRQGQGQGQAQEEEGIIIVQTTSENLP